MGLADWRTTKKNLLTSSGEVLVEIMLADTARDLLTGNGAMTC